MKKARVRFTVELNLDPVAGFNSKPQDFANRLRFELEHSIPHYEPTVSRAELVDADGQD